MDLQFLNIPNEIINLKRKDYQRNEILDLFFEYTKNVESIKTILNQADSIIKWNILDKLKTNNHEKFVEQYLLMTVEKTSDNEELGKAAEVLVSLQNLQGLKIYIKWIKNNLGNDISISRAMCLNNLKSIETIPYLLELLEISYIRESKVTPFDRFYSQLINTFYNIALISEENLNQVRLNLQEFIIKNSTVYKNAKYLFYTLEKIEEQFYMNYAQSFNIKQVKEKLKLAIL